ncbi:MAG: molybdate transport system permease protein, partial [Chloroflexota bacterium]|nr:molybdate transport system permease protein [Chloroflexota bacterium]
MGAVPVISTSNRVPLGLALPAVGGVVLVALPLLALVLRAPWPGLAGALATREVQQALLLSAECSFAALAVALLLGVPLAWVLARVEFPGRRLVRALVTLPMVLPPVVAGVSLL